MSKVNVISLGKRWREAAPSELAGVTPSANFSSSSQEKHPRSFAKTTNLPLFWLSFHWFHDLHRAGCKVHFVKYTQTIKTQKETLPKDAQLSFKFTPPPPQLTVNGGFRIKRGSTPQTVLQCNSYTSNHKYNERGGGGGDGWRGGDRSDVGPRSHQSDWQAWNGTIAWSPPLLGRSLCYLLYKSCIHEIAFEHCLEERKKK